MKIEEKVKVVIEVGDRNSLMCDTHCQFYCTDVGNVGCTRYHKYIKNGKRLEECLVDFGTCK